MVVVPRQAPRLLRCLLLSWSVMNISSLQQFELNRAKFLSSSAARFIAAASTTTMLVVAGANPETCQAAANNNSNPRYIDQELKMSSDSDGSSKNPRSRGMLVRRFTGDSTPYSFPIKPVSLVKQWPETCPFRDQDFTRQDPTSDSSFYAFPKLVYHIDEPAVASLTQYYRKSIPAGSDILDICSSWVSHYPLEFPTTMRSICATGISGVELQFNDQLSKGGYKAVDLNATPKLPFDDNSFDAVTCVVSIDYLIHPVQVLREVHRVLRPGGKMIVSQSNRCFPTKAIRMWLNMNDRQHLELINGYFQYAGGFEPRQAFDITATVPGSAYRDPMFIVEAVKSKA